VNITTHIQKVTTMAENWRAIADELARLNVYLFGRLEAQQRHSADDINLAAIEWYRTAVMRTDGNEDDFQAAVTEAERKAYSETPGDLHKGEDQ
jgi:hypothetical protein